MGNGGPQQQFDPLALARLIQAVSQRQTAASILQPLLGPFAPQQEQPPLTEEQSRMGVTYPAAVQPADILGLLAGSTRTGAGRAVLGSERGAVGEASPLELYHGSHESLTSMKPRPVEKLGSFGTWFTSSPETARRTYGPNVTRSQVPSSLRLKEMPSPADFDTQLIDPEIARTSGHAAEAKVLSRTLPNNRELQELNRSESLTAQQGKRLKELGEARRAAGNLYRSPQYMQALRKKYQSQGYDGLVWKQSRIDQRSIDPGTHDVYVVFHGEDIPAEGVP